jgi:hypothetical protein
VQISIKTFYREKDCLSLCGKKLKISRIALETDISHDVVYRRHDGMILRHTPWLSFVYDRVCYSGDFDDQYDISMELAELLSKSDFLPPMIEERKKELGIEKQGMMFLQMLQNTIIDPQLSGTYLLVPTVTALLACMQAGWKIETLSQVRKSLHLLIYLALFID